MHKLLSLLAVAGISSTLALPAMAACPAPPAAAAKAAPLNLDQGRRSFLKCRACHTLPADGKNLVGPNLWNTFSRAPLGAEGFKYSPALTKAAISWTAAEMDAFLEKPAKHVPGTRMVFAGIPSPEERANLIAYLASETGCK